jgi:uncharacterized protein (UPF0261 family)
VSPKAIAIVAALDTIGVEARFIQEIILDRCHRTLLIYVGVMNDPEVKADVSSREVAQQGVVSS